MLTFILEFALNPLKRRFATEAEPLVCSAISASALDMPVMFSSPQYNVGLVAAFPRSGSLHYEILTKVFNIAAVWLRLLLEPLPYIS
jgi:hypothetical protein